MTGILLLIFFLNKTNFIKFKCIDIIQNMFSNHNEIKSEINKGKIIWTISKQLELSNALINNPDAKAENSPTNV